MDEDQWYAFAKSQQSADWKMGYSTAMADLRAKVEALHAEAMAGKRANKVNPMIADAYVARAAGIAAVLALIDGKSDD